MKSDKRVITVDPFEHDLLLNGFNEFRNMLLEEEKPTEDVDELLLKILDYQADFVYGGRLPVHVHFVMDEFANVALPDDFDKLLATMRSREISVSVIYLIT